MEDSLEHMGVVEASFLSMGAHVTLTLVCNVEYFGKASSGLGALIEKYAMCLVTK